MARSLDFKILMRLLLQEMKSLQNSKASQTSKPFATLEGRRNFLKTTALGSAALALAGCGTFDRWVMGDSNRLDEETLILGGGLAGLTAAYHLKTNKAHYRVYEASSRAGGRIQTLFHTNSDGQFVELGAEFFEGSHKYVLQLCKDLGLNIQEVSYDFKKDRALYWLKGKVVPEKEFRKNLKPLAVKLAQLRRETFSTIPTELSPRALLAHPASAGVDQKSLASFLETLKGTMDGDTLECFEKICVSDLGVDSKDMNLLHFLVRLDFEERGLQAGPLKIYRVEGGMSRMVQILAERVQGIVPNSLLRLEHQLVAIRGKSGGYECTFKTPKGSDTVWARSVICALPWSVLKNVDGIQSIELGLKKDLISHAHYATHSRVISSFKDPVWKRKQKNQYHFQGVLRGQLIGQHYWDSSRGQAGASGLLCSQRGGSQGLSAGAGAAQESLEDLRHFYKEAPPAEATHLANWSQKPFAKGSRFNLQPGSYLTYLSALTETQEKEKFYIAGEHWSFHNSGSMNGAIETGLAAAEQALQDLFQAKS